ncbi:oligosaccharide flippase family protein [Kitasatospora sp. NPDC059571]|uniref:oligosaccharide flippase family protein n=1 Tax=Kitasatospora sp. NPDC059571 TaxID=3346871 RepID=UPI0036AE6FE9
MAPAATAAAESRTTFSALLWNYGSAVAGALLQLGYTALTARVVSPDGFGAFAAAGAALTVMGYVAGAGLATYLLRAERLTRQTVRTAYRVSLASGALCCLATLAVAPLCADLWGLPAIEPTVQLYALYFLPQPASLVALAALRRLDRARLCAVTETVAQLVGMATGAVLLTAGWSPYGLVVAQCVAPAVTLAVAGRRLAQCRLPSGPAVRSREMLGLSGAFAGYGMIQVLSADVPLWAITRYLGPAAVGEFSRAALAVGLPVAMLGQGLRRSVMPSMARLNGGGRSLAGALPDMLSAASAVAFVSFGALAGVGPAALHLLLGPGWDVAAALMPVFAVGAPLVLLCQFSYAVDEILRATGPLLRTQLLVLAATVAGVLSLVAAGRSLALLALATSLAAGAGHLGQLVRWSRRGLCRPAQLVRPYAVHALVGAALCAGGRVAAGFGTGPLSQLAHGILGMVPVLIGCVAVRRRLPLYTVAVSRGLVAH